MATLNKHKIDSFLFAALVLTLLYPSFVTAVSKTQRVHEVCECRFPAEIGAFKYLKVVRIRYTLFKYLTRDSAMVREVFAERNGDQYRILSLVDSTETSTVGKEGPIIEIVKWNGPYWPGKIIYQLALDQIRVAYLKMIEVSKAD